MRHRAMVGWPQRSRRSQKTRAFLHLSFGKAALRCKGYTASVEGGVMVTLDFEILRHLVGFSVRSRHPRHCCARSVLRGARLVGDLLRLSYTCCDPVGSGGGVASTYGPTVEPRGVSTAAVLVSAALAC